MLNEQMNRCMKKWTGFVPYSKLLDLLVLLSQENFIIYKCRAYKTAEFLKVRRDLDLWLEPVWKLDPLEHGSARTPCIPMFLCVNSSVLGHSPASSSSCLWQLFLCDQRTKGWLTHPWAWSQLGQVSCWRIRE